MRAKPIGLCNNQGVMCIGWITVQGGADGSSQVKVQHTCSSSALRLLPRLTALPADARDSAANGDAARMGGCAAWWSSPLCAGTPLLLMPLTSPAASLAQEAGVKAKALSHGRAASWIFAPLPPKSGLCRNSTEDVKLARDHSSLPLPPERDLQRLLVRMQQTGGVHRTRKQ